MRCCGQQISQPRPVTGKGWSLKKRDWNLEPQNGRNIQVKDLSGQIIATSHDLTPHGRVVGEPCLKWPYFREIQVGEIL